ncbi:MAG TPA: histidine--tRNA ligase [Leptospiraceae bacterium]|nr:histidine--tRNA ligase [Leptospiraceae bacterium]HMY67094.1 histidine--tRNA ligase [Leptospiraceae bacterium]HNF15288.1 histidine--tRNA ligase [Leptospiraceae bacterium]HNI25919.1 histidine--tRNA ligase [Leptospiraceae bacterium]HNI99179.1 histidine--tRNA ligase [Leptospiraceae bacterium]
MSEPKKKKLSTENYKGTRDFYPEDMKVRNWMFSVMRKTAQSFGYREYDGPMLESFDVYKAKSGEEIVGRQLYNFIDKGERHVAIRPEMTPTLARMVAARLRDLQRPIRWFSIPNLWRYEAPGHGRLREHWQLNVDLFGVDSSRAELEIILLAAEILSSFGADSSMFKIQFSHRKILNDFLKKVLVLNEEQEYAMAKLLDKRNKITEKEFKDSAEKLLDDPGRQYALIEKYLNCDINSLKQFSEIGRETVEFLEQFESGCKEAGIADVLKFDPSIIRGFDYYTGFIFEIFDMDPENRRSLYGGGRYDNLVGLFSNEQISGIGFGLGDVTLLNFLKSHGLVPDLRERNSVYIPLLSDSMFTDLVKISSQLRKAGISAELSLDAGKFGKQISAAEKKGYSHILIYGEDEKKEESLVLKNLNSGEQKKLKLSEMNSVLQKELNS